MERNRERFAGSRTNLTYKCLPVIANAHSNRRVEVGSLNENSPLLIENNKNPQFLKRRNAHSLELIPKIPNTNTRMLSSRSGNKLEKFLSIKRNSTLSVSPLIKPHQSHRLNLRSLVQLPKVIENIAYKSVVGSVNGRAKKANQDSFFIIPNFNNTSFQTLFGVMDGHGLFGEQVSSFLKAYLPTFISSKTETQLKNSSLYPLDDYNQILLNQSLCEAYQLSHNELCKNPKIDTSFSGSTAVTVLIRGKQCICSNTGDSRAVLGRFNKTTWEAIPLSKDHKPDDPIERQRIERSNGRVEAYKDHNGLPIGPLRVWLKNEQFPGLAMSRSIGDTVSTRAGVICIPEVTFQTLDPNDKFIVLASDGIWEFITNDEIVQIVSNFYYSGKLAEACDQLIKIATYRWSSKDIHIDDITVVIVSLKVKD